MGPMGRARKIRYAPAVTDLRGFDERWVHKDLVCRRTTLLSRTWHRQFVVVNGQVALSDAQPPELFLQAFEPAGQAIVAGKACKIDPAAGKRGC